MRTKGKKSPLEIRAKKKHLKETTSLQIQNTTHFSVTVTAQSDI